MILLDVFVQGNIRNLIGRSKKNVAKSASGRSYLLGESFAEDCLIGGRCQYVKISWLQHLRSPNTCDPRARRWKCWTEPPTSGIAHSVIDTEGFASTSRTMIGYASDNSCAHEAQFEEFKALTLQII